jgi:hypothetical protein
MKNYSYAIIQENYPELQRVSTLLENNYKPLKYAFIEKIMHKDGSESISRIIYSNDLEKLQNTASGYISWYNYPANLYKEMQGNIYHISKN